MRPPPSIEHLHVPFILFNVPSKPVRPALHGHYTGWDTERQRSEVTQGLGSPQPTPPPPRTHTTWEGSGCKPCPLLVQALSRTWERRRPGTLPGPGGDSSPPSPKVRAGLARWKSRARPETRCSCREIRRKTSAFFSFLALTLPAPRPPPVSPPRGLPPRGAPPPPRRRPTVARLSLAFVGSPIGGADALPRPRLWLRVYKNLSRRPQAHIGEVGDGILSSAAVRIILPEDSCRFFPSSLGEDFAAF